MKRKNQTLHVCQSDSPSVDDFRKFVHESLEAKIRAVGLTYILQLLNEEVEMLCGPRGSHKKHGNLAHRGGSEVGSIAFNGQRTQIRRPRVRKDGQEVELERYQALQSMDNLGETITTMMLHGTSTRSYQKTLKQFEGDLGLSKSSASRQFVKNSRESLNHLNTRKLEGKTFWAIFIDGVNYAGSTVIVALGVDTDGNKHFLGISEGSSENSEVCIALLQNILERDVSFTEKIVAVMDGSKALKKAVVAVFGKRVEIQRCLLHKRRNVEAKLGKKYHDALKMKMAQAYNFNDYDEAKKAMEKTVKWLANINHSAAESLEEGLEDLLTLHRVNMPPALRKSFYTTNPIESAFSTPRARTTRVKRWRKNTDQVLRWSGSHLLLQEESFRKVNAYQEINNFLSEFAPVRKKRVARRKAG